jgi:hypothetical protein
MGLWGVRQCPTRFGQHSAIQIRRLVVKNSEIIADNLSKAGWSYGYVSALDREGRTIWIADAHRGDRKAVRCACG